MVKSTTGKTQADGAFEVAFDEPSGEHMQRYHQIQAVVRDSAGAIITPSAGSLAVQIKSAVQPGSAAPAPGWGDVAGTIDLTSTALVYSFEGFVKVLQITPTGLDADKTYDVHITSRIP